MLTNGTVGPRDKIRQEEGQDMKKLIVLAMLVMAVAVWGQTGPDLTINAKIEYIGAWDQSGKTYSDKPMYELKFNWVVDDYNTAYLEFEEGPMSPASAPVPPTGTA
jgi:hypothetical protein